MHLRGVRIEAVDILEDFAAMVALNLAPDRVVGDEVLAHIAGVRRHFVAQQALAPTHLKANKVLSQKAFKVRQRFWA